MNIYIAASWRHQHAVEMLTTLLRAEGRDHNVLSFVENESEERTYLQAEREGVALEGVSWYWGESGRQSFEFDTDGATKSDVVIYVGASGQDAAAEVGAAWASGVLVLGLWAKAEGFGLMRRMVEWFDNHRELLARVDEVAKECDEG